MKNNNRTYQSKKEMFPIVEAYYRSGQSQKEFCAVNDLSTVKLGYWITRYRRSNQPVKSEESEPSSFGQLEMTEQSSAKASPAKDSVVAEVVKVDGTVIRLYENTPAALIKILLTC